MSLWRIVLRTCAALLLASCNRKHQEPPPPPHRDGGAIARSATGPEWYRVEIDAGAEGHIPFFLAVAADQPRGYVDNGAERIDVDVVQREPLVVHIPVRGVNLELRTDGHGAFTGTWTTSYIFKTDFPLSARKVVAPDPGLLFTGTGAPAADLSGEWRLDFEQIGPGRAMFHQDSRGLVSGTIWPTDLGDQRYLHGRVWGDHFALTTFDGIHALVFAGDIEVGGKTVRGRWMVTAIGTFPFTARRGDLPGFDSLTTLRLRRGAKRLSLPALSQPPFQGSPVIVDIFGTWCPNCMDLMPELVRLHSKYAADGLQVLSIALEPGDPIAAQQRIAEIRKRYGITWPIELQQTDDFAGALPDELENVSGFPVTAFIHRDGTVAAVHAAFVGPAAGSAHEALVAKFESWTEDIVRAR